MEDLDALLADLQITTPPRCPVLLTDSPEKPQPTETRPPPPPYDPKTAMSNKTSDHETFPVDKDHLYSTVQKYPLPSVSPALGGGLCELDRLLNELNATQFNITDEIMSQFPTRDPSEQKAEAQKEAEKRALSASSATLELDRLMASLSDFHKQNTVSQEVEAPGAYKGSEEVSRPGDTEDLSSPRSTACVPKDLEDAPTPKSFKVVSAPGHLEVKTNQVNSDEVTASRVPDSVSGSKVPEATSVPRSDLDSMLVKLQSGLKQQGIETYSKGLCESCQRPIAGQVVTALGHTWHPEHFVCAHCHTLIGTTNFFEKDGRPYCEKDYFMLYAPRCALCELPIVQNMVTALGCTWHPEHFCCKVCKKPIGEEGFHEKDGEQYCSDDYFRLFGAVCAGCTEAVKESYISALGGLWHPQCFVCHVCHTPFINGSFFEHEGLPLCETHYHSRRGSLCAGCEQPITGRCVTAMGKKFHPQHLNCTFCLRQLNKGTFREHDEKPYCQACYARLYG
ncbi:transforming growth factor beta-1-induced transcript 1 protein [Xenopus laevis]|nr:transforming growth factor beta-1-induced transcript 1 protein [Xenopus laevis]